MGFLERYVESVELQWEQQLGAVVKAESWVSDSVVTVTLDNPLGYSEYDFEDIGMMEAGGTAIRSLEAHEAGNGVVVAIYY
jgi:hypothetical protein